MADFISDDEMDSLSSSPDFISDEEMERVAPVSDENTSIGSKAVSFFQGLGDTSSMGFGDEAAGLVGAGIDQIASRMIPGYKADSYSQARDQGRAISSQVKSANPKTAIGGQLAGAIASGVATGKIIPSPSTFFGRIALSMGYGGAEGIGTSDADLTKGELGDAALDTAKGAAIGGVTAGAMEGLSKLPGAVRSYSDQKALKSLGGNKAAFKEQIKRGTNLGREAMDEGIIRPFSSTESMLERADLVKGSGWDKMSQTFKEADAIRPSFVPDEAAQAVKNELGDFYRSPLNRDIAGQFDNTVEAIAMRGKNPVSLEEGQLLKKELDKIGFPKGKRPVSPSEKQIMSQDASRIIADKISDSAEGVLGEQGRSLLKQGRAQYGTGKQSGDLLTDKLAREQSKGGFSISDLIYKPISSAISPQTQAWTGDKIAKVLQSAPQMLGKYAPQLQQAMHRGANAFAATNFLLHQQDPGYQKIVGKLNGQNENEGE